MFATYNINLSDECLFGDSDISQIDTELSADVFFELLENKLKSTGYDLDEFSYNPNMPTSLDVIDLVESVWSKFDWLVEIE